MDAVAALGGDGEGATSGDGGNGGVTSTPDGVDAPAMIDRGEGATGGGGGACGRLRINTLDASRISGLLTPSLGSGAATVGVLRDLAR
jgi:hypothetical protein